MGFIVCLFFIDHKPKLHNMKYEVIEPKEADDVTVELLEESQSVFTESKIDEERKSNLSDCKIFTRGNYWVIIKDVAILYWEYKNDNYPFFENALHYMNPSKKGKWKTVNNLILFRNAIREAAVQGTQYCEMLHENISYSKFKEFLKFARAHDLIHHGQHTF